MTCPFLLSRFRGSRDPPKRHLILRRRSKRKINSAKYTRKRLGRLKVEMEEISQEQQSIKEGQSQVRAKFKSVEEEYKQLRNETNLIIQQTANTQIRLGLMFGILKAREQGDLGKAAQLTRLLREIVGRNNYCRSEP
ncbi:uncharacterized protein LOC120164512 [Hibiscus syriacus]|uniref:uncharacterized protein LOC120164512 n=1 Tax=Hibiscus syriacus TaxID=106335 RepID=UPI0019246FFE|nr:uncharacterized protein LOC120164512 [Hibiscus syriacus]XP_039030152.1 uncharacterized protein LOC120164512 [Hibiscus syriacus]XP_039030153.1 uncharacterized protein LOC120164512 [Hibiscus syriacus]